MHKTFKQYLNESYQENEESKIYIDLSDRNGKTEDKEIGVKTNYKLIKDTQNYDHEKPTYEIDPMSIDYEIDKPFVFNGKSYKSGQDLMDLYMNVFFEDKYLKQSSVLRNSISNYFMKKTLSPADQDKVFLELLRLMIEDQI